MSQFTHRAAQPYFLRRIFYGIIALVGAALFGFGVADAAQIDQWMEAAERLIAPLLMIITSSLAGVKANPGSDQPAPPSTPDLTPTPQSSVGNDLLEQLRERIAQNRG